MKIPFEWLTSKTISRGNKNKRCERRGLAAFLVSVPIRFDVARMLSPARARNQIQSERRITNVVRKKVRGGEVAVEAATSLPSIYYSGTTNSRYCPHRK